MNDLAVIMSVYQKDRLYYLKQSVESILTQTYSDFDYLIVCDGPVIDEINHYLSSLKDDRIKLFRLEKNEGLARALNYLLRIVLANSDYKLIARMDADDISMPARFEKQRNFLSENPDISCVGSWYEEIDEDGKHISYRKLPADHENLRKRYFTRTSFAHPSVMYRRELIEKAGYYPPDTVLMEDNVLWGKALLNGFRFANITEYLLKFRIDKDFYKRRSGLRYGWRYIKTRIQMNRMLKSPLTAYPVSFIVGFAKMLPASINQTIYMAVRKIRY